MRYNGGKSRLSKDISAAILRNTTRRGCYIEPFLGGASVAERVVPHFESSHLSDFSLDLVLFWQAVQQGWIPPDECSEQRYSDLKAEDPSPERGFVGYFGSFGGKWFGGYARGDGRNYLAEASRAALKLAPFIRRADITHNHFSAVSVAPGDVVYCDPPYRNTTAYGNCPPFDYEQFTSTIEGWSDLGATVFVSEYEKPSERAVEVWSKTKPQTLAIYTDEAPKVIERLFLI